MRFDAAASEVCKDVLKTVSLEFLYQSMLFHEKVIQILYPHEWISWLMLYRESILFKTLHLAFDLFLFLKRCVYWCSGFSSFVVLFHWLCLLINFRFLIVKTFPRDKGKLYPVLLTTRIMWQVPAVNSSWRKWPALSLVIIAWSVNLQLPVKQILRNCHVEDYILRVMM